MQTNRPDSDTRSRLLSPGWKHFYFIPRTLTLSSEDPDPGPVRGIDRCCHHVITIVTLSDGRPTFAGSRLQLTARCLRLWLRVRTECRSPERVWSLLTSSTLHSTLGTRTPLLHNQYTPHTLMVN